MILLIEEDLKALVEKVSKYGVEVDLEKHMVKKDHVVVYLRSNANLGRMLALLSDVIDEVKEQDCK
jgi:hypothetical protein